MKTYQWFFLVIAILMWNGMLIQRDKKMFDGYDKLTPKEQFCKQQSGWHPDCNLE